jgi:hypothetical protein
MQSGNAEEQYRYGEKRRVHREDDSFEKYTSLPAVAAAAFSAY